MERTKRRTDWLLLAIGIALSSAVGAGLAVVFIAAILAPTDTP